MTQSEPESIPSCAKSMAYLLGLSIVLSLVIGSFYLAGNGTMIAFGVLLVLGLLKFAAEISDFRHQPSINCEYGICEETFEWVESYSDNLEPIRKLRCDATFMCSECGTIFDSSSHVEHEGELAIGCPKCGEFPRCLKYVSSSNKIDE